MPIRNYLDGLGVPLLRVHAGAIVRGGGIRDALDWLQRGGHVLVHGERRIRFADDLRRALGETSTLTVLFGQRSLILSTRSI
jgi:predicted lipoprotein